MLINRKKQISFFLGIILAFTFLFSTAFATDSVEQSNLINLSLDKNSVQIQNVGFSEYVNAVVTSQNGISTNVNADAKWRSDDSDIVYAENGRLLAMGKGNAKVTVSYKGFEQTINVKVLNDVNYEKLNHLARLSSKDSSKNASIMTVDQWRRDITNKASRMLNYAWTPTRDFGRYRPDDNGIFKAGTTYYGIPYTKTERYMQVDESLFYYVMSNSDFYTPWSNGTYMMPKYGNDCSGFSSFAWGIYPLATWDFMSGAVNGTYKKVKAGTTEYNMTSPSRSDLITCYASLQEGDVVVAQDHMFIIDMNYPSSGYVWAYEQTPTLPRYAMWTYSDMANGQYRPISKY